MGEQRAFMDEEAFEQIGRIFEISPGEAKRRHERGLYMNCGGIGDDNYQHVNGHPEVKYMICDDCTVHFT